MRLLISRRADKSADKVRAINRLQAQLLEYFPALERAFSYSRSKGALLLLTKHRTPDGTRCAGETMIHAWLKKHGARSSATVAAATVEASKSQHTIVPAQHTGEGIVAALAREILALNEELAKHDYVRLIGAHRGAAEHARLWTRPCRRFIGANGGDLTVFQFAGRFERTTH